MGKKYKGKDIFDELETKEKSPIIPIAIFLCVVTILGVITTIGIKLLEEHTNIDIPWTENKKKPGNNKVQSSRDQMDLVVPTLRASKEPQEVLDSYIDITKIEKDKNGFYITFSLQTNSEAYSTIEVKQVTIDGFYFTTTFALSDKLDYSPEGYRLPTNEQKPTIYEFLIKKTELDALDMFGFNTLSLIYDMYTPTSKIEDRDFYLNVNNDLNIVNDRKDCIYYTSPFIPTDLYEAATIDGANKNRIFWRVIMPLSKPIVVYTILLAFTAPWGDYMFASVMAQGKVELFNVAVGLQQLMTKEAGSAYFPIFCAAGVLVSNPIVILFFCLQSYYVEGVTGGAVKG